MQVKRRTLVLILSLAIGILTILVLMVGIMIFLVVGTGKGGYSKRTGGKRFSTYQVQQVDANSEKMTLGIARIPSSIQLEEFVSYSTEEGNPVLISEFGTKSYHCSGSCACDGERRTVGVFTGGISALLAALTLTSAYQLAKGNFEGMCLSELSDECPPEAISSEVDECHAENPYRDLPDDEYVPYLCAGKCVDGEEIYDLPVISISNIRPGFPDCEGMDLSMNIKIKKGLDEASARDLFLQEHLKPYCAKTSVVTVEAGTNCCRATHKVAFCTGGSFKPNHFEYNRNVHCQKSA